MSEDAATPLEKAPSYQVQLEAEPWRFDFYAAMRRLERSFPDRAKELFEDAVDLSKDRYAHLMRLSGLYAPKEN